MDQTLCLAVILLFVGDVLSSPIPITDLEQIDMSYQNDREFKELLQRTLNSLEKSGIESAHERILAVNDAHRQYRGQNKSQKNKDISINAAERAMETNMEHGLHLFEGDVVLQEQDEIPGTSESNLKRSNALRRRSRLWETRVIPYSISPALREVGHLIRKAVRKISSVSCLRFFEVSGIPPGTNLIYYDSRDGCWSKIGTIAWKKRHQTVSLGSGCQFYGTILHETMHAVGFWHEQGRLDRDKYVKIKWENILRGKEDQFEKYGEPDMDSLGIPYDYHSIMHYSRKAFTQNGNPTIQRLDKPTAPLGSQDLSSIDILALNLLYDCKNSPVGHRGYSSWTKWTSCTYNDDCSRHRERFCINAPSAGLKKRYCPGSNFYGVEKRKLKCPSSTCAPIDAGWGMWSKWGDCNVKCGPGKQMRYRRCTDPPKPKFGGKPCPSSIVKEYEQCTMGKCHLGFYETQFDGSMGRWKRTTWQRQWKLFDSLRIPGPLYDHTTHKRFANRAMYAGVHTNSGKGTAKLTSPWMKGTYQCITFFYVIDGASAKALAVRLTQQKKKNTNWYISYKQGPRGRAWQQGMGQIDPPHGDNVQISFEALTRNVRSPGMIAIDDIYFHPGKCQWPKPTAKPSPPPCVDIDTLCSSWAAAGECKKNPKYMLKRCRKSCVCQPPVECKDKNPSCKAWVDKGQCKTNAKWMLPNCCLACRKATNA